MAGSGRAGGRRERLRRRRPADTTDADARTADCRADRHAGTDSTQEPAGIGLVLATTFTFRAEGFSASDNSTLTYAWDFGDGARQTGATVSHVYPGRGLFAVTVTVSTASGHRQPPPSPVSP